MAGGSVGRFLFSRQSALCVSLAVAALSSLWLAVGPLAAAGVPVGTVTIFNDPGIEQPYGITAGPDGALWFTNSDSIGRITTDGQVTRFTDAGIVRPYGITAGADGALWFVNKGS